MAIDTKSVSQLIAEFRKLQAKDAITKIQPLSEDRNNVYANIAKVSLTDGSTIIERVEFIHQDTTERAGAMRAQQAADLNTARKNQSVLMRYELVKV